MADVVRRVGRNHSIGVHGTTTILNAATVDVCHVLGDIHGSGCRSKDQNALVLRTLKASLVLYFVLTLLSRIFLAGQFEGHEGASSVY